MEYTVTRTVVYLFSTAFYATGAFLAWITKGCTNNLKEEFDPKHRIRNGLLALGLFVAALTGLIILTN